MSAAFHTGGEGCARGSGSVAGVGSRVAEDHAVFWIVGSPWRVPGQHCEKTRIAVRMAAVTMSFTGFNIADVDDGGMVARR